MRSFEEVLRLMEEYKDIFGEEPLEDAGFGEGDPMGEFLAQKFNIKDKSFIQEFKSNYTFLEMILDAVKVESSIERYQPKVVFGVNVSDFGYFEFYEILGAEYLCSEFCSQETYDEIINSLKSEIESCSED